MQLGSPLYLFALQHAKNKMPQSLDAIAGKLDKLVELQGEKTKAAVKEPTEEEQDEERLCEVEAKLEDLVDLLSQGATRDSSDAKINEARSRVQSGKDESKPLLRVFHQQKGGKRISTTRRTQSKMHLADALKLRLRVGQHAQDLEHALHVLVKEQVQILERQLARKR